MSGLFGSSPPPPPIPDPKPPPPMPDPESPEIREKKRLAALDMLSRAGRESTILTRGSERGPTGDYSRRTLGGS